MLTKSDFMRYLEAPRHLWAARHHPTDDKGIDPYQALLAEQGYEVERAALRYAKEFLLPSYGGDQQSLRVQPSVQSGDYGVRADILLYHPARACWDLYEVKASNQVQQEHEYDVTYQALVLEEDFALGDVFVLHLNKEYVRRGELDLESLFALTNMTEVVQSRREEVGQMRENALLAIEDSTPAALSSCDKPKDCPCPDICHPDLPGYSIYDIARLHATKRSELLAQGIVDIQEVPVDFLLTPRQRQQVAVAQSGQPRIDHAPIQQALDNLTYPLHFLDYETFNPAIPLFDGYQPYVEIPFQFSLHTIGQEGSEAEHREFLWMERTDPGVDMIAALRQGVGEEGTVIVWNQSFEQKINKALAKRHPESAEFLHQLNARIYDLSKVFSEQWYADPHFRGRHSIKKVLPVLCPELDYESLDIGDGTAAMTQWHEVVFGKGTSRQEAAQVREALLRYCKLDTYAMVRVWEVLRGL